MDWMAFFKSFFESKKEDIERILDAQGCREGWLQGEIFLYAPPGSIQTNTEPLKYDLVSKIHPMLAEIKICGGDYQPKMETFIQADVDKLLKAVSGPEKYMILVIDTRQGTTHLGQWLEIFNPCEDRKEVIGSNFKARIWRLADRMSR